MLQLTVCSGQDVYKPIFKWMPADAGSLFSEAEILLEKAKTETDDASLARYWFLAGLGYLYTYQPYLAEDAFRNALRAIPGDTDQNMQMETWIHLGRSLAAQKDFTETNLVLERALGFAVLQGDISAQIRCHVAFGKMEFERGDLIAARVQFEEATKLIYSVEKMDFPEELGDIWYYLARITMDENGNAEVIRSHAEEAVRLYEEAGAPFKQLHALYMAVIANLNIGETGAAGNFAGKSIDVVVPDTFLPYASGYVDMMEGEIALSQLLFNEAKSRFYGAIRKLKPFWKADSESLVKAWRRYLACIAGLNDIQAFTESEGEYTAFQNKLNQLHADGIRAQLAILYGTNEKNQELRRLNDQIAGLDQSIVQVITTSRRKTWLIATLLLVILTAVGSFFLAKARAANRTLKFQVFTRSRSRLKPTFRFFGNQKTGLPATVTDEPQLPKVEVDEQLHAFYRLIRETVERERLYLKSDLTVQGIAQKVGLSDVQVSNAVNMAGGVNINTFMNQYRLDESIRLIKEMAGNDGPSFSDIAMMSGFKSYSTFYRVFKQLKGQTPKAFLNAYSKTKSN